MTKKQPDGPAVTLEQLESEIAEHDAAKIDLTAARHDILTREKRERLAALENQLQDAIKGKDGAYAKRDKAHAAVAKAQERLMTAKVKEREAIQQLSMAELELRQVRHQIDTLERDLES